MISVAESFIKKLKRLSSREPRLPNDSLFFVMRKLTTPEFIERSKKVHGNKYDYSLVYYKKANDKVKIICKKHGVFNQTPDKHMNGRGCHKCGNLKNGLYNKLTKEMFVEKSMEVHGSTYDYSLVDYNGACNKVIIKCRVHGKFNQTPTSHLSGSGCNKCGYLSAGNKNRKTKEKFIKQAKLVHGDRYDYSLVDYKKSHVKIKILCRIHGLFIQSPDSHLQNHGCPKCGNENISKSNKENPTGWAYTVWEQSALKSKNFDSFKVYIIRCWNDKEEFYKIGRTFKTVNKRFIYKKEMPYDYEILNEFIFDTAKECCDKEYELKISNKDNRYIPKINFSGGHECFSKII